VFFGNKSQPLLGLDITTSSVKLIELSRSGKRYRVESYSAEPTPPSSVSEKAIVDAKAVGEAIRRAVKRAGAKATDVAVAISGDAAITKVIQMPSSLSERDLEGQVEIQADQYIPFPMEEVSFDFEVIGPNDKDPELMDVLLVATRTENVEQRQSAVNAAGLQYADRRRRGVRSRECLSPSESPDSRWRHGPVRRRRRHWCVEHHVQRPAGSQGHLHA